MKGVFQLDDIDDFSGDLRDSCVGRSFVQAHTEVNIVRTTRSDDHYGGHVPRKQFFWDGTSKHGKKRERHVDYFDI